MTASRPDNEVIFHAARDIRDPDRRHAYIREACGGDETRIAHVEALLAAADGPDSLLDRPAAGTPMATIDQPAIESPGTVIGPYKLLQEIGQGGMGVVYMAEQHEPVRRKVALKIIKPGMDTRQVIVRFEAERQALSLMDHPNIAKVLDAGTTESGRPFFVMELVKGQPITDYCDEHHLTPRQRLELLLPVCQAIQHAHQKGIIHRDIKPSNILIAEYDQQAVPKVIDFGVAKAISQPLTEKTMFTGLGQIVGTLEYIDPEQAKVNQLDIDTRSDIYSLGVLMYELLTGSTPFDKQRLRSAAWDEMLRIIREEEPPRPSTKLSSSETLPSVSANRSMEPARLSRTVRGELDWIVMKALEKDRNRRYETTNALAADLQHYLADEPVAACPPSAGYRLRKFARRNKGGLAVAALVLFFLVLLGSGVGWAVRDQAARQSRIGAQVDLVLGEVEQLAKEQKWPEALAAARRAEAVVAGGEVDTPTAERVRDRLRDLGFIDRLEKSRMRATWVGGQRNYAGADREYAQTFREYGVDVDELPIEVAIDRLKARPALVIPVAVALDEWSQYRWIAQGGQGDDAAAKRLMLIARGIDPDPLRDRVRATWRRPEAEVRDELRRVAESIDVRAEHPATLLILHLKLLRVNQADQAVRLMRDAQRLHPEDFWLNLYLAQLLSEQKDHEGAIRFFTAAVSLRPRSSAVHTNFGVALADQKKLDEAVACYKKAIELDPKNAMAYSNLGNALRDQKKLDEAIACYKKAIELDPKFAIAHINLGVALADQKKLDEAVACYKKAIELDPKNAMAYINLGIVLSDQWKVYEAIAAFRKAVELDPKNSNAHGALGNNLRLQGKLDEAIAEIQKAIELDPKNAIAHINLGVVLHDQKKLDEAVAAYRKAIELDPKNVTATYNLVSILRDQKKLDEAVAEAVTAQRKAIELDPKYVRGYTYLGSGLRDQKKLDEAIACYQKAIDLDPKDAIAHAGLGRVLHDQKKQDEAVAAFRKAIELDPKYVHAYIDLGSVLRDQKKLDEAIVCYKKAIEFSPRFITAYVNLGNTLHNQKKLDEAIVCCKKAIELAPKDAGIRDNLALCLNELAWDLATHGEPARRDPGRAVSLAKEAVELNPKKANYYNTLGTSLYRAGRWKDAIEALERADQLSAGKQFGHNAIFIAMAHWQLGNKEEAHGWYAKAVEWMDGQRSTSETLMRFRGEAEGLMLPPQELAAARQRRWDRELADLSRDVEQQPGSTNALSARAHWLHSHGRFEEAERDYEQLVKLHPEDHWHWYYRACLLAYLEREEQYRKHCRAMLDQFAYEEDGGALDRTTKSALLLPNGVGGDVEKLARRATLTPDSPWASLLQGMAECRAGRHEQAIDWLEKCRTAPSDDYPARPIAAAAYLAIARHQLGQLEEARAVLEKATRQAGEVLAPVDSGDLNRGGIENWLIAHTALREAEATILARQLPAPPQATGPPVPPIPSATNSPMTLHPK